MNFTIALAGKGGTGKTTLAALIIEVLKRKGLGPVLAVDADPNTTLGAFLGINPESTVSDIINQTKGLRNLPEGVSKPVHLEYQLQQAVTESSGVDLLVMGQPEGPDCYCLVNNILRGYVEQITRNYKYVVIDNEAGMEHLSRKTTQNIDALFIVSEPTRIGLKTAKRIKKLIDEFTFLAIRNRYLVLNKTRNNIAELEKDIQAVGIPLTGSLPYTEEISELELAEKPMSSLSDDSPLLKATRDIISQTIL